MQAELGSTHGLEAIRDALHGREPVIYTDGGPRTTDGVALLNRLEALMPRIGITRLADISPLAAHPYPVYQCCRPNIATHPATGQNTGSQGKGRTALQAKLSCLMEEVEAYCAEPRDVHLLRGAYSRLKQAHALLSPRRLTHNYQRRRAQASDALMWTPAHAIELGHEVLVPAEAVFFPFCPQDYATDSFFPCSTNGLGAGATYLEAIVHGLYEVIERHYLAFDEVGEARRLAIDPATLGTVDPAAFAREHAGAATLRLWGLQVGHAAQDLPMVVCHVEVGGARYGGYGCSASVDISVERAVSEALQAMCVDISGAREDLEQKREAARPPIGDGEGDEERLTEAAYRRQVVDRRFTDLHEELEHLLGWLHRAGYPFVCVANLTRVGIDVPVVRVLVPGLPCMMKIRSESVEPLTHAVRASLRHGYASGVGSPR